jgi:hypothetical protein
MKDKKIKAVSAKDVETTGVLATGIEEKKEKKVRMDEYSWDMKTAGQETQAPPSENYPTIKRMLVILDKFLDKRIAGIGAFYLCACIGIGAGLIFNGVNVNASIGGEPSGMPDVSIWLYSALATATFIFALVVARVIFVRVRSKKNCKY